MYDLSQQKRFIFTGTPGSGKTSVINELEKLGYFVIHEAATAVIGLEQSKGIEKPWDHPDFMDKIIYMQKEHQMKACEDLQFYDRSPFCTYALCQYLSDWQQVIFKASPILLDEIDRCIRDRIYQKKVFFFENLGFIEHTNARKISYEEALIFEQIHLDVYKKFGFDVVVVPRTLTVVQRCDFIMDNAM